MEELQEGVMMMMKNPQGGMMLPLHTGDQNGNAFSQTSSSSCTESPSSSRRGEASPDSTRSLSSLSSGRVDSPLDVDMPEGDVGKKTGTEGVNGHPDTPEQNATQRQDCSESVDNENDKSVSVYLDATDDGWNENITLVITELQRQDGNHGDVDVDSHGNVRVYEVSWSQSLDGSQKTEAPLCSSENDDDKDGAEEEEDSFLSVSSGEVATRSDNGSPTESERAVSSDSALGEPATPRLDLPPTASVDTCEALSEKAGTQSSDRGPETGPVDELHEEAVELPTKEGPAELSSSPIVLEMISSESEVVPDLEGHREVAQAFSSPHDSKNTPLRAHSLTNSPSHRGSGQRLNTQKTKEQPAVSNAKLNTKTSSPKSTKPEIKRFPRPDLRNVKARIISRPTSAPRLANPAQGDSNEGKQLLAVARLKKEENQDGGKRQRSSSVQARMAAVKPSAGHVPDPKVKDHQQEEGKKALLNNSTCQSSETTPEVSQERRPKLHPTVSEDKESVKETGGAAEGTKHLLNGRPTAEETHKSNIQTVSSKLGSPATPAAGPPAPAPAPSPAPASKPKPPGREWRPAGSLSPPRGQVGIPKARLTDRSAVTVGSAPSNKTPQISTASRIVSASKLPIKGLVSSLSSSSVGSNSSETNTSAAANRVAAAAVKSEERPSRPGPQVQGKPPVSKVISSRGRVTSIPTAKSAATGLKNPATSNQVSSKPTQNPLQRSGSARLNRQSAVSVDKNKPRPAAGGTSPGPRSQPCQAGGQGEGVTGEDQPLSTAQYRQQSEKKSQHILQLRKLLTTGNRHMEALALVIQHLFTEREDALKQKQELSGQLSSLREELGKSLTCCERLEKEKEEVQVAFEAVLQKLQEQHQEELVQLEERLKEFYSAEWEKTHQMYQEEADRCRALMQQQVEEVRSKQEALRREQEESHTQQVESLRQSYESSVADLIKNHEQELQNLDKTLKESETSLNEKIEQLTTENSALSEKLKAEEERRKILAETSQKDSHTLYLEQELESLKVVLEIKTNQLHQQERKLMQMDKLVETNVKLEESLKKVQQENEDYKARMDKHAALSKQLSTEQALLQQTLQKESKVNKRLSMENEELLWKLHNCDLSSPRRVSPSSPFASPRNSASFSSAPLSPR
ncbi:microtubule-associated tumor suppressor 1 homolog [Chanos chanos]|uniref:Microtubule-associated tumor suppressor 1 homolog n=1 Tax=Chanos chanos TaxID=29144 RepID=A0A6J2WJH3_CHACN|nr:microtubule-associated tumor suppressor 1 [Chanos chanos]